MTVENNNKQNIENGKFNDYLAQIIADALKLTKDKDIINNRRINDIMRYSKVVEYFNGLEKDYFEGKSQLNADTFYELYSTFCDYYMLENFCAKVLYYHKLSDSKIYNKEIENLAEKRIIMYNNSLKTTSDNASEEYLRLISEDKAYFNLIHQRNLVSNSYNTIKKKENKTTDDTINQIKLKRNIQSIDIAIGKKEKDYNKLRNERVNVEDCICEIITGTDKTEISKEMKENILKNIRNMGVVIESRQDNVK